MQTFRTPLYERNIVIPLKWTNKHGKVNKYWKDKAWVFWTGGLISQEKYEDILGRPVRERDWHYMP